MSKEFNGGYTLKIGGLTWDLLNGYSPSWTEEEQENFENYDFSNVTTYKGIRFLAAFKIKKLSEEDKDTLLKAIEPRIISIECPDYTGTVKISGVSAELTTANHLGKWYDVSFSAAAAALTPLGDGL